MRKLVAVCAFVLSLDLVPRAMAQPSWQTSETSLEMSLATAPVPLVYVKEAEQNIGPPNKISTGTIEQIFEQFASGVKEHSGYVGGQRQSIFVFQTQRCQDVMALTVPSTAPLVQKTVGRAQCTSG